MAQPAMAFIPDWVAEDQVEWWSFAELDKFANHLAGVAEVNHTAQLPHLRKTHAKMPRRIPRRFELEDFFSSDYSILEKASARA